MPDLRLVLALPALVAALGLAPAEIAPGQALWRVSRVTRGGMADPGQGGLHEPAGMTTLINDNGSVRVPAGMIATKAWSGADSWGDRHTAIVPDASNPTGSGYAIEKRWLAGDGTDAESRPGLLQVDHWSALNPAFRPVKTVYVRLRVWLDPGWPPIDAYNLGGFKFFYLKTSRSANYVIWTSKEPSGAVQWASLLNGNVLARVGNLTPGRWHTVEYLFQMNSAPGIPDGSANIWLDGALLSSRSAIMWVGASSNQWACDFDGMQIYPLRGAVGHTFPQANQMRYGEIYVSGR